MQSLDHLITPIWGSNLNRNNEMSDRDAHGCLYSRVIRNRKRDSSSTTRAARLQSYDCSRVIGIPPLERNFRIIVYEHNFRIVLK